MEYQIGVDLAEKINWWKKILVWLKIKKNQDYSCLAVSRKDENGIFFIENIKYF